MSTLPNRNLPGTSQNWGRQLESINRGLDREYQQVSQRISNGLRTSSSQIASISNQISTIFTRTTQFVTPANLSVTGNNSSIPSASRTFSFSAPDRDYWADVELYGRWSPTGGAGNQNLFAKITYQGSNVSRMTSDSRDTAMTGSGTDMKFYGRQTVLIPQGVTPTFTLTIYRVGFTSTTTTETLRNLEAFLTIQSPA